MADELSTKLKVETVEGATTLSPSVAVAPQR